MINRTHPPHFCRDLIVKYGRIEDAQRAFEDLTQSPEKLQVVYVPTKHNSDEVYNFQHLRTESCDQAAKDACFTLNMFKIKTNIFEETLAHGSTSDFKCWDSPSRAVINDTKSLPNLQRARAGDNDLNLTKPKVALGQDDQQ